MYVPLHRPRLMSAVVCGLRAGAGGRRGRRIHCARCTPAPCRRRPACLLPPARARPARDPATRGAALPVCMPLLYRTNARAPLVATRCLPPAEAFARVGAAPTAACITLLAAHLRTTNNARPRRACPRVHTQFGKRTASSVWHAHARFHRFAPRLALCARELRRSFCPEMEACGWRVIDVEDGCSDVPSIVRALHSAKTSDRPTFIRPKPKL
ncbi:hypothetical protein EON67_05220 [archaeon]|nr:MAG: hypothetical protein EON67_05220 [archaeon]